MDTTTGTKLHEYLRGDIAQLEAALDELEHQARTMRRRLADLKSLADDVWNLEEPVTEEVQG